MPDETLARLHRAIERATGRTIKYLQEAPQYELRKQESGRLKN